MTCSAAGTTCRGTPKPCHKRPKFFGDGFPLPMDRNAKARLKILLHALKRPTEKGKHFGALTGKAVDVALALLFMFHNERSGLCFPSYEAIAEAAGCNRGYVAELLAMLERAGILTWCHRLKRVPRRIGGVIRSTVERTSNGYRFVDPTARTASIPPQRVVKRRKSEFASGTAIQPLKIPLAVPQIMGSQLELALERLGQAVKGGMPA
jgi:Helix-turn-helix domain